MNKEELLRCVREKSGKPSIKFPSEIDFQENNHVITLTMWDSVAKNMQDDSAAFEGWALCLKASLDAEARKCCLKWKKPDDPEYPQYQRFLYRVDKFDSIFGGSNGWFFIDDENKEFKADLQIKDNIRYYLNSPSTSDEERRNDKTKNKENRLENEILGQQDNLKGLAECCPVKLHRQLPVGLFHTKVREENAIFPSKHSAIDLWGAKGDGLYILELKAKGNCKIGVLSELFFYTMVLRDEQARIFTRESDEGKLIGNTKQIKAFILAPELHPFITQKVFVLLNEKSRNQKMEFGWIKFGYVETDPNLRFNSFERQYLECY
ncbi:MAG: hypothetical protein WAK60_10305 [Sedimentisphaerales bacterium]